MLRADPTCASDNLLLAAGILSAPQHAERRSAQRRTWLSYPNVGRSAPICPLFVARAAAWSAGTGNGRSLSANPDALATCSSHLWSRTTRAACAARYYRSPSGSSTRRSTLRTPPTSPRSTTTRTCTRPISSGCSVSASASSARRQTQWWACSHSTPGYLTSSRLGRTAGPSVRRRKGSGRASRTWTQRSCEWTAAWDPSRSRLATSSRSRRRSLLKSSTRAVRAPMPIASSGRTQRDAKLAPTASAARQVWCWRTCGSAPCSTAGRRRLR